MDVREGSFDWKFEGNLDVSNGQITSNIFKIGKDEFRLILSGRSISCTKCSLLCHVYLKSDRSGWVLGDNVLLKLYFIDRDGKEHFKTKIKPFFKFSDKYLVLMVLRLNEIGTTKTDIFSGGIFTLRLSWNEEREQCAQTLDLFDGNDSIDLFKALSKDLAAFYESQKNTDCVLRIGTVEYPAHRAVLSARSEVFEAMFHHDTAENRNGVVNITDVNISVMSDVLYYMYAGQIRGMTVHTAALMYTVADKYALPELRDACTKFLKHNITFENVCDAAVLAHIHAEQELEDIVIHFIEENSEELLENNTWKEFTEKNSLVACKYLHATLVASKKGKLKSREK